MVGFHQILAIDIPYIGCEDDVWGVFCEVKLLFMFSFNSFWPRQHGWHFPDDIFKWIFLNENIWILIKILSNFFHRGPINKTPALIQIMAWHRPGDKPLSEPMLTQFTDTYMQHYGATS